MLMAVTSSSPCRARRLSVSMSCSSWTKRQVARVDLVVRQGVEHEGIVGVGAVADADYLYLVLCHLAFAPATSDLLLISVVGTIRQHRRKRHLDVTRFRQEMAGRFGLRGVEHLSRRARFHHAAGLHDVNGRAHVAGKTHRVRDHDHRLARFAKSAMTASTSPPSAGPRHSSARRIGSLRV